MKILLVSPGYDSPDKHPYGFYNIRDSLIQFGAEVIDFDWKVSHEKYGYEESNKQFIRLFKETNPDILWQEFCMGNEIHPDVIEYITNKSSTTSLLFMSDDEWRLGDALHFAGNYNFAITNHAPAIDAYHARGIKNVIHCQWAANPKYYYPINCTKKYDITFVGSMQNRLDVVYKLKQSGFNINLWGGGWETIPELAGVTHGRVSHEDMLRIFSESKISLVLNWSGAFRDMMQVKGRVFELGACKTFQLNHEYGELGRFFDMGKEMVCCNDNNITQVIKYYLENNTERERIAEACYHRILREHTWQHRYQHIFSTILKQKPSWKKKFEIKSVSVKV